MDSSSMLSLAEGLDKTSGNSFDYISLITCFKNDLKIQQKINISKIDNVRGFPTNYKRKESFIINTSLPKGGSRWDYELIHRRDNTTYNFEA